MVTATITVDMGGASSKVRKIASNRAFGQFLASEAQKGMDKYVPMRTGALASSATVKPFHVVYKAPYAMYVYNGRRMKFSTDKHPNATSHWDRAYAIADGDKLAKAASNYLKSL